MLVVAVTHEADEDRRRAIPDHWDQWRTRTAVGETYHRLAEFAAEESWGIETVVVQDDIKVVERLEPGNPNDRLVVYSRYRSIPRHACPRAFAASTNTWRLLAKAWSSDPVSVCPGFLRVISKVETRFIPGLVEHTEEPGTRPMPRQL